MPEQRPGTVFTPRLPVPRFPPIALPAPVPTLTGEIPGVGTQAVFQALLAGLPALGVLVRLVVSEVPRILYQLGAAPTFEWDADVAPHMRGCVRWHNNDEGSVALLFAELPRARLEVVAAFPPLNAALTRRIEAELARVQPAMLGAADMCTEASQHRAHLLGMTAAVEFSEVATVLLDDIGEIMFANREAQTVFAQEGGLRRRGNIVACTNMADTLRLRTAIEHVTSRVERHGATSPVLAIHREGRRPLLAAVVSATDTPSVSGDCAAILYVFDPDMGSDSLLEPTCKLYHLSPAETRLSCLLTRGLTLVAAAEALRIREDTARTYLKQIFLKTNTRRQTELVWVMLRSSVRAAAGVRAAFM